MPSPATTNPAARGQQEGNGWLVVESPGEDLGGPFHADTGQLLRELTIDPTRDRQSLGRPPGPHPKTP